MQEADDLLSISKLCADRQKRFISASWDGEKGRIVDQALSPDETMQAVACLSSKNLKLLKLCSYKSFVAELRVHIFTMPAGHCLHQVTRRPSHEHLKCANEFKLPCWS